MLICFLAALRESASSVHPDCACRAFPLYDLVPVEGLQQRPPCIIKSPHRRCERRTSPSVYRPSQTPDEREWRVRKDKQLHCSIIFHVDDRATFFQSATALLVPAIVCHEAQIHCLSRGSRVDICWARRRVQDNHAGEPVGFMASSSRSRR